MSVTDFAFYAFALVVLVGAMMTVTARNPVHAVLWLITAFVGATGLFVLLGAELLAMLLMIVYVGAVMVLFLFVVMMLDVDFEELKSGVAEYTPIGLLIGVILLMELGMVYTSWQFADQAQAARAAITPALAQAHNTRALGLVLYDQYVLLVQLAGLILLVAMIGAIVLTLRHRPDIKRQNVVAQMHRDPAKTLEMKDVKPGQGL